MMQLHLSNGEKTPPISAPSIFIFIQVLDYNVLACNASMINQTPVDENHYLYPSSLVFGDSESKLGHKSTGAKWLLNQCADHLS